ncbi:MAG: molybdenum cofactor biosynthesis protein MoaE [Candidatus Competibacteraceae bacterium]|nr:molybdenum cofactor biosynthesis protein MoaE [Candidatus Competibacteraceae bacterium]
MHIEILHRPFDPLQAMADHQKSHPRLGGRFGATASFIGTMRDYNEGDEVSAMVLEHYPGMTERHLERIAREAMERWQLLEVLIIHRVGELRPNDAIVLVAVWSAHRKEAFEACRHLMEDLKSRAPFWKRETLPEGRRWVEKNTPG